MSGNTVNSEFNHVTINANGVDHHVVSAGSGPPLVCVHGFPEDWYSFRHQLRELSGMFTVIAYDLRGVGRSRKPGEGYNTTTMADDLIALIDALGLQKPALIGHDWGGSIVPIAVQRAQNRFSCMVVIDAPLGRELRPLNSWYIWAMNKLVPWADGYLSRRELFPQSIIRFWAWIENQDAFTAEDIDHYSAAYYSPGTIEAWLSLYRSVWSGPVGNAYETYEKVIFKREPSVLKWNAPKKPSVDIPAMLIWGEEDPALPVQLAHRLKRIWEELELHVIPDCGHFPHEEKPEEVNRLLLKFLSPIMLS